MDRDYDSNTQAVKTSAFDCIQLKKGLSVSRKELLTPLIRQNVITQLEKNLFTFQLELEALRKKIEDIEHDTKYFNIFSVEITPTPGNPAHADVKFTDDALTLAPCEMKKYRKKLMDAFGV